MRFNRSGAQSTARHARWPSVPTALPCLYRRLDGFEGQLQVDPAEVCETRFVDLAELRADVGRNPEAYTLWLREEAASLGWFGAA